MLTLTATGDSFITRTLPEGDADATKVREILHDSDVRFTNFETLIPDKHNYPAAQGGGTWASSPPQVLEELKRYGFNLLSWANNHTLDFGHGGIRSTQQHLDAAGFVHAGVGANLAEASAVRYLECQDARVALIAGTSTFHPFNPAGEQRRDILGRPGVNPLGFESTFAISEEHYHQLKTIANASGINNEELLRIKEGFSLPAPEGILQFGNHLFTIAKSGKLGEQTHPARRDMDRFCQRIQQARASTDIVLISIHSHEISHGKKDVPAQFLEEFAHICIDYGADAVIGHGPHILRGIEIYRDRPIFYSLGDFIFQYELEDTQPTEFYQRYDLGLDANAMQVFAALSDNGERGLGTNPRVWQSVIARWKMDGTKLGTVELIPISLGFDPAPWRRGWPKLTSDLSPLRDLQRLSAPYGTEIQIKNGIGVIA